MPARKHAENWVITLRDTLKGSVGSAYRVMERRGKTKLDVRFDDGSRGYATLDIPWLAANSRTILSTVERIAGLVSGGHTVKSAADQLYGAAVKAPAASGDASDDLLRAWNAFGAHKVGLNKITASTWAQSYKSAGDHLRSIGDAANAESLLERFAKKWKPGSRQRKVCAQQVVAMLRWATSREGKFILSPDRWSPPAKSDLDRFVGEASAELKAKTTEPNVPFSDQHILELLEALPVEHVHPRDRKAAKQWRFAFQLMACYGLRPVEINYLGVRENGKKTLWSTWIKRTGGGTGKPRRLFPFHPEWEKDWDLIDRVASGESLPSSDRGVGQIAMEYLKRMDVFKPMHQQGCTSKSFRHAYSKRCHQIYGLSDTDAAAYMGHSTEAHNRSYAQWTKEEHLEQSFELALKRRSVLEHKS